MHNSDWIPYLIKSALDPVGLMPIQDILAWYQSNRSMVRVERSELSKSQLWYHDQTSGRICHRARGFFEIAGLKQYQDDRVLMQPILIQKEIGYLGLLTTLIDDQLYFLIQAKIEPGNVNKVQFSPTIQATKSNFMRIHGGRHPYYLDYFMRTDNQIVIADQLQSEQSSRFLGKRNRNIILFVEDEIKVEDGFIWLTLGQLHALMRYDNLVNMDTRTVLSCLPFNWIETAEQGKAAGIQDHVLFRSMLPDGQGGSHQQMIVPRLFRMMNNYKMFNTPVKELCRLDELTTWEWDGTASLSSKDDANFRVIFCDIEIEGRELRCWDQPLFEAIGRAIFALFYKIEHGRMYFMVAPKAEAGCFDDVEIGPTLQLEAIERRQQNNIFLRYIQFCEQHHPERIRHKVVLSEEGGRFYCEENDNYIVQYIPGGEHVLPSESDGYFWLTYRQLNDLNAINNVLNIQLRNLMSLLSLTEHYE